MKHSIVIAASLIAVGLGLSSNANAQQDPRFFKSFSSCTSVLCIDAPPEGPGGLDGSGGWGYDPIANKPVTQIYEGKATPLTVTVMQPTGVPFCGAQAMTITLTFSSQDFTLSPMDSAGNTGVDPFDRGGVLVFTYTGDFLCHMDQSIAYSFTPQHTANVALVTAKVDVVSAPVSYNDAAKTNASPKVATSAASAAPVASASETFPVMIIKSKSKPQ